MDIIITEWALQSYLELRVQSAFTADEYKEIIRPDVAALRSFPMGAQFRNSHSWGPATLNGGVAVADGYKMKWHNLGPGRIQLRLCVAMIRGSAYLCHAYVKNSEAKDKREAAKLLTRIDLIQRGQFQQRGRL